MITQITGTLLSKMANAIVVECNHGLAYELHVSAYTFFQLPDLQAVCTLFTHQHITEKEQLLFGFTTTAERELFRLLISVSGIGVALAREIFSDMSPSVVKKIFIEEDTTKLNNVKGIGKKTAQRLMIELKDKVSNLNSVEEITEISGNKNSKEALEALEVLGFQRRKSEKIIEEILSTKADASVEFLVKEALNRIS